MKSALLGRFLLFFAAVAGIGMAYGQDDSGGREAPVPVSTLAMQLGTQVKSIADSKNMSRSKKEQWISTAVRVSVVAATAYDKDPGRALATATRLASAAARAAPSYADMIAKAVAFSPTIARIAGASGQIRSATFAAARGQPYRQPAAVSSPDVAESRPSRTVEPAERPATADAMPDERKARYRAPSDQTDADLAGLPAESRQSQVQMTPNGSAHVTLDSSVQRNDNVYLSNTNRTKDTVLSITPGIQAGFGQHTISHGELIVQEAFTHYQDNSAPNAHLANATGNLGYAGEQIKSNLTGAYQQLYQNNADYTATGQKLLLRTDTLNLSGNVEVPFATKMAGSVGANLSRTEYKNSTLVGNRNLTFPLSLYYTIEPKLDLSGGFSYGTTMPTGAGPKAKDLYYNIGARGSFSPKLTGTFSVGTRKRSVDAVFQGTKEVAPAFDDNLLGFDGSFEYQATEKTNAILSLSRNFGSSALGQTTKGSQYALQITSNPTPQFSISAKAAYRLTDNGPAVFATTPAGAAAAARQDKGWENSLGATYTFTKWLTLVANYTFRNNRSTYAQSTNPSTQTVPDYNNNVFSLTLGLQY